MFRAWAILLILMYPVTGWPQDAISQVKLTGLADVRAVRTDDSVGWLDQGLGKTRYGAKTEGKQRNELQLSELALAASARFWWDLAGQLTLKYDPDQKNDLGILEGFISYRPVSTTGVRFKARVGAFFPPISLENTGVSWTSPYSITPSAINSWIGEEVRTIGAEASVEKKSDETLWSFTGGLFQANDPAGSLLAYRGWAMHDRKLTLNDRVPLAPIASIQAGNALEKQVPWVEPFDEIDDRWGYYTGLTWKQQNFVELRALYYDNRADPTAFDGQQYAWHTRFTSLGARYEFENELEVLAQYMSGDSTMGRKYGWLVVDIDFSSYYLLVSQPMGRHRMTLRYDHFETKDIDNGLIDPLGTNDENGDAWTVAYSLNIKRRQSLMFEALYISSDRPARSQIGTMPDREELQLQINYRLFFRN